MLNYSQTKPVNEERILNIIEKFDESSLAVGNSIYVTTKYAWPGGPPGLRLLGRQRRADQHRGPRQCLHPHDRHHERKRQGRPGRLAHPHQLRHRYPDGPEDIANVIAFLVSPLAHGINGNVLFVDGGTDALLNSEKVY